MEMNRRTLKREFFTDEAVGALPFPIRFLFLGCLVLADDEGLLRWSARGMKNDVFSWDDDLSVRNVNDLMGKLATAGMLVSYDKRAGRQMGWLVHFARHQLISRPVRSVLPPPPIDSPEIACAYAKRDGWICGLCGGTLDEGDVRAVRVVDLGSGGDDYPRNVQPAHPACIPAIPAPAPPPPGELDLGLPPVPVKAVRDLDSKVESNAGLIVGEWIDHCPNRPPAGIIARVGKAVKGLLADGMVPFDITTGLAEWQDKGLDPAAIPSVVNEVMNGDHRSTADKRVAAGMKLADEYRSRGE